MTVHRSYHLRAVLVVPLAVCIACANDQPGATDTGDPASLEGVVTGAAAAAVGADGRFKLPAPPAGPEQEISGARAVELADAWAGQFARFFEQSLESGRGAPVDIQNLTACGRPLYAKGNYEPLPPEVPLIFRRPFQSYWFVALCGGSGQPEVSLAVSATSTDLWLVGGKVRFPRISGNNFFAVGIPEFWTGGPLPYSPEGAALEVAGRTGKQVVLVPELRMPDLGKALPQGARWLVTLNADVLLQGERRVHLPPTRRLYVGVDGQDRRQGIRSMSVPSDSQPATTNFYYGIYGPDYKRQGIANGTAIRKNEFPVRFEVVREGSAP